MQTTKRLLADTSGQDLIEYAVMGGLVAMAALAIMPQVATAVSLGVWGDTSHTSIIRLISAVMAAIFLGIIVFRQKKDAE